MSIDDKNQEFELIMKTSDGDEILKNSDTVLVKFGPERNGIITSWLNIYLLFSIINCLRKTLISMVMEEYWIS